MRCPSLSALVLSLSLITVPAAALAQWVTAGTDTLAGTSASERSTRFSVAVDATNAPHAIWSVGASLVYSRKQAAGWLSPIELSHPDAAYAGNAVVVRPGSTDASVLYSRTPFGAPAGELLLAEWNGNGFSVRTLTADGAAKFGPVLAIDASGAYHVVCVVQALGEWRLRYLTNVTGSQTDVLLAVGSLGPFGSGASPAIAVEPNGIAHVVYRGVNPGYRIHHAENSAPGGTSWSWQELFTPNAEDTGSDVELDASGGVHVVASGSDCDVCTRHTHVFERPVGGNWSAATPIVHTSGLTQASLAVDPGKAAHVMAAEISGSLLTGRIFHASALTGWVPSLVIGNDHGTPSLAIDAQGRGHLVCTTGPNTGSRNVLYLQSAALTTVGVIAPPPPTTPSWQASPNPFSRATVLRFTGEPALVAAIHGGARLVILDIAGRAVRRLSAGVATNSSADFVWDGRGDNGGTVPPGVYRIALVNASGRIAAGTASVKVVKLH